MTQAHLTVRTPTDILDVVPTLIGFAPTESLVVIYLDAVDDRARIAMSARMDLPTDPLEFTATRKIIEQHAHSYGAMILVAYSVDAELADRTLVTLLNVTDLQIEVAISASADGWAEVGADEPIHRCPYPDGTSVMTTAIVAAGLQHSLQTRDDLASTIAGPNPADANRFAALLEGAQSLDGHQLTAWLGTWSQASSGQALDVDTAAVLAASVQNIQVRDAAWAAISSADAERHINLWRQVAGLVDGRPALPVLGLLGMAAWIGGQGALANMVLDRAEQCGGDQYTLFGLLKEVLQRGINPRSWDGVREAIVTVNEGTMTS